MNKRELIKRLKEAQILLVEQDKNVKTREKEGNCIWSFKDSFSEDINEYYQTSCGRAFEFNYTKREKEFAFCPYCSKTIFER